MQKLVSFFLSVLMFLFPWLSCGGGTYEATPGESFPAPFTASGDRAEEMTSLFNGVYALFGGSDEEHSLVYRFGNEAAYFDWMAKKILWTGDRAYTDELKAKIASYPQTDNGYLWSWGTSTYWPTGRGNMHYDGLFSFISAVDEIIRWENSADFLFVKDTDTWGNDTAIDASLGRTVYEKCSLAMKYALQLLGGTDGVITLTESSVYLADGMTRFDLNEQGIPVWNNTGLEGSASSNYWDNFCFGHIDAYETVLFYNAVKAMTDLETVLGHTEKAAEYASLAAKIHTAFDEYFWNEKTGRYIGCIDINGVKHDLGFTFLNCQALAAGLGDREKADKIFSWLYGDRIVFGDTSRGKDINDYTAFLNDLCGVNAVKGKHPFVMRSVTASVESRKTKDGYWWESLEGSINACRNGNAEYGKHLENGGYIFWTVYYELASLARFGYTDKMAKRIGELAGVYAFNGFDSDAGNWAEGLIGEFPENGIVSRIMVSELLGFSPENGALKISPALPMGCSEAGTQRLYYGGGLFSAAVGEDTVELRSEEEIKPFDILFIKDGVKLAKAEFLGKNGEVIAAETYEADSTGGIRIPVGRPEAYAVRLAY